MKIKIYLQIQVNDHDTYGFPEEVEPAGRPRVGDELPAHQIFTAITDAACKAGAASRHACDDCKTTPSITVTGPDGTEYTMNFGAGLAGWILFGITLVALVAREAWRIHTGRVTVPETVRVDRGVGIGGDVPPPFRGFPASAPPLAITEVPQEFADNDADEPDHPYKGFSARTPAQEAALNWAAQV